MRKRLEEAMSQANDAEEIIDFRLRIEMADNFTSQTFFDVQH